MTRGIIAILMIGHAFTAFAQQVSLDTLRFLYFEEWVEKCGAEKLVEYTDGLDKDALPVFKAYRGAGLATTANCTSWPLSKISRFNDGKKLLEGAIQEMPESLEIRFLRYTIQKNIPSFLGYDNLEDDREFVMDRLTLRLKSGNKDDLDVRILKYLLDSGEFTREQILELESAAAEE